ncbi:hypothetical protein TIFTF001_003797 [Ficus carica]|uniref:Uncharacterized protein n=1 Tax=Ficus carica TaxID=3494 RepID=A0AA87ZF42_FICCA|nr:hypothetical protein TIFTF001_003797 [Ficus carica]
MELPTISVLDNGDGRSRGLERRDVRGSGPARWHFAGSGSAQRFVGLGRLSGGGVFFFLVYA